MGAYEPKFLYGDETTATCGATITNPPGNLGQLLAVVGNGTVGPAGAAATVIGCAAIDAAVGDRFAFFPRGKIHVSLAAGAITAGDRVNAGAAGTVATGAAAVTNAGVALTTAADGAAVEWMEF